MRQLIGEAENKRKREEEEAINNNPLLGLLKYSPGKKPNKMDKFANALRMSLTSAGNQDFDFRNPSYLTSMRKLFEDLRML